MKRLAQVSVLAADRRPARRQFRINECAQHRNHAAGDPHSENQQRGVQLLRDDIRVDEDAGADDAAHDDHGGVEESHLPEQSGECVAGFELGGVVVNRRQNG